MLSLLALCKTSARLSARRLWRRREAVSQTYTNISGHVYLVASSSILSAYSIQHWKRSADRESLACFIKFHLSHRRTQREKDMHATIRIITLMSLPMTCVAAEEFQTFSKRVNTFSINYFREILFKLTELRSILATKGLRELQPTQTTTRFSARQ